MSIGGWFLIALCAILGLWASLLHRLDDRRKANEQRLADYMKSSNGSNPRIKLSDLKKPPEKRTT